MLVYDKSALVDEIAHSHPKAGKNGASPHSAVLDRH